MKPQKDYEQSDTRKKKKLGVFSGSRLLFGCREG
jgi:hypothetical protein